MTKTLLAILFGSVLITAEAAPLTFGPAFDKSQVTPVANVIENPAAFLEQSFTIEGKIQAVCQKQGCWMTLAAAEGAPTFRVKVRDGDMVFPLSSIGKTAYAHGRIQPIPLNLAATIDYLEAQAEKSGVVFDPKTITEPVTLYQFSPTSVEISE